MPELVVYDESGQPETVRYHVLSTLLLNELQVGASKLQAVTARLARVEAALSQILSARNLNVARRE